MYIYLYRGRGSRGEWGISLYQYVLTNQANRVRIESQYRKYNYIIEL